MGDYKWISYDEGYKKIVAFSNGLLDIGKQAIFNQFDILLWSSLWCLFKGVKSKGSLVLFSETRLEWMITALSCYRINVTGM